MAQPGFATPALATRDLCRSYSIRRRAGREIEALDHLTLTVERGEVHGLLGPNGAGKSTLMKIWSTVLLPTSGRATVLGHDVVAEHRAVRAKVGIVFGGERGLYPRLTGRDNLRYWAALYRLDGRTARHRTERLLAEFGLAGRAADRVETYSTGMRQRLHLARGLIGAPGVLLLDEPTNGLDPVAAHDLRAIIRGLAEDGRTVVLATHDMAEAEAVCDRVSLIDQGRLVIAGTPREVERVVCSFELVEVDGASADLLERVRSLPGVTDVVRLAAGTSGAGESGAGGSGGGGSGAWTSHRITVDGRAHVGPVLHQLVAGGAQAVRTARPGLEEAYLRLVRGASSAGAGRRVDPP